MAASKNMIALEINGLHVYLAFAPFPADDTVATVRTILKTVTFGRSRRKGA